MPDRFIRSYDDLQLALRRRADELGISRLEIDRIAGLPTGYAAKVLCDPPVRRMSVAQIAAFLGALGLKLEAVSDEDALAKYTARADKREEFRAKNATMHAKSVHIKIPGRKIQKARRKGGENSRKYLSIRQKKRLAKIAAKARWKRRKYTRKSLTLAAPDEPKQVHSPSLAPINIGLVDPKIYKLPGNSEGV